MVLQVNCLFVYSFERVYIYALMMFSDSGSLCLLGSLHDMLDSFEPFFPLSDLLLYGFPFSELDLTKHMALDDDFLAKLIDFCVNDLVLNSIYRPEFYLVHINLHIRSKTED